MNLDAELLRRNARLRAWRAYGVPVAGGWERQVSDRHPARFTLRCTACDAEVTEPLWLEAWAADPLGALREAEDEAHYRFFERGYCLHLSMANFGFANESSDPEEVQRVTALEILAGG